MYIIILKNTEKNLDFFDKIKVSIFKIHFYSQKSGNNSPSKKGRFKEMAIEINKVNHFRLYESREEAEKWLL